ncbi:hypothetical protein [Streptomyces yaizuensis]|uniref:Uncharacterized protein n=1 Tax=Streptomyces yaizuensis TaxID=2989713 RepID=A0ABQ5P2R7_9ACTN|nr:hypothetical protein [Streptomyces sp. YSPA8]GLF96880.1 hypothetical protein SYYSPA8_21305 [Streptomyces sp. YSPA8]
MLTRGHDIGIAVLAASVAAALLTEMAATVPSAPAVRAESTSAAWEPGAPTPSRELTLITGDRVRVGTRGPFAGEVLGVRPAPGRERITFRTRTHKGRVLVLPDDARGLVDDGRLDPRLFDPEELGRPAGRVAAPSGPGPDGLRIVVRYGGGSAAGAARAAVRAADGVRARRSSAAPGADAVTVGHPGPGALWEALTDPRGDGTRTVAPGIVRIRSGAAAPS